MSEQRKLINGHDAYKIDLDDIAEFEKAIQPLGDEMARIYKEMNLPLHWGTSFSFGIRNGKFERASFMNFFLPVEDVKPWRVVA